MKKTININLGGLVFQIDEDAFERLSIYLETLKKKFHNVEERTEIIQDIEYRFAELFNADFDTKKQVVSLEMVNSAIITMGEPEEIEEDEEVFVNNSTVSNPKINKKLFRDPDDQVFAGVISGVSKYFGIQDAIWLRIAMVLLTIASIGVPTVAIYILLWIVMPVARTSTEKLQMNGDSINIENIENQVKKNINSEEIKRTTAKIAHKASEIVPVFFKVLGIILILLFGFKLIAITIVFFGLGFLLSFSNPGYSALLIDSNYTYIFSILSLYFFIATPLVLAIYLAVKIYTKKKINWIVSLAIASLLFIFAGIGLATNVFSIGKNFKTTREQTNFVALENPTVDELNIEFPYEKLEDELNLNIQFGNNKNNDFKIRGLKLSKSKNEIYLNNVELDIRVAKSDTIFKLSKTIQSKGKNNEDAEEKLSHIVNEFENLTDNTISIPRLITLENETKWRDQKMIYKLYVPIGKRIYFGDHAKKVIDDVEFNGEFSKKDLANNTWEMTNQGLICITCN